MKKKMVLFFLTISIIASVQARTSTDITEKLVGIWAMEPLANGVANVIEFNKNGIVTNNMFYCDWVKKDYQSAGVEVSRYEVEENGVYIVNIDNQSLIETALVVDKINSKGMSVRQLIDPETAIELNYVKVSTVKPLCHLKENGRI